MKTRAAGVVWAAVAFLAGAQIFFVAAYITHEHTIYFWDHAMYFNMARQLYEFSVRDFASGWGLFRQSLADNYNLVFALPSLASFALFGPDRPVFILTNYFVFFLAYEIAVAFLLHSALSCPWRWALFISLVSAALIPPLWLPLLEGYPDSGAAACIVAAAALALGRMRLARPALNALLTGVALGFSVLLRRHFVYAAIALLLALFCLTAFDILRAKKNRRREISRAVVYFALCGFGFAGIIFLIAPAFLRDALTTDYAALYLSYKRAPLVFLRFVLGGFGYGLLLIATSGLVLLACDTKGRRLASFIALYVFLWLVIWCAGPDQMGHHYILHALPLFVNTGIAGWMFYLAREPRGKKYVAGAALAIFLVSNSAWALWFSPHGVWPNDNGTPGLFSAPRPPVVRSDYAQWLRLADYLKRTTGDNDRIMMIGSSFVFNQDLMRSVYTDIIDAPDMIFRFVRAPEIDHEEPAPLDAFASANIYLVPEPAQYHLDPEGQRVITAAANRFPPANLSLFRRDDEAFHLEDGVTVHVWRRKAWKPPDLFAALAAIRHDGPQDDGFVQDWVVTAMPLQARIRTDEQNHSFVTALFDPAHPHMRIFFDFPLAAGDHQLETTLVGNCPDAKLSFSVLSGEGRPEAEGDLAVSAAAAVSRSFTVPKTAAEHHFLELAVTPGPAALCRLDLQDLFVERMP